MLPLAPVGVLVAGGAVELVEPVGVLAFAITGADGVLRLKADPYAFHAETRPGTASKLYSIDGYHWADNAWRESRHDHPVYTAPSAYS